MSTALITKIGVIDLPDADGRTNINLSLSYWSGPEDGILISICIVGTFVIVDLVE